MCGIAGWIDFTRDLRLEAARFDRMVDSLSRRGPDAAGKWITAGAAIGHRRLSVVDVEGGRQPMALSVAPGRPPAVLTFSGEVYNYRELRSQLAARGHVFITDSDTEVLLRGYLEWGASVVDRLTGMFAFGIWDADREELLLARDRIGVKPLYYYAYSDGLVFGSEPKVVLAHPGFAPRIEESALPMLFNPRLTQAGSTPLLGLNEVRPGHVLRFSRSNGPCESRYWRLQSSEYTASFDEAVAHLRELLTEIVKDHLNADVPLAALLSGGLDSSAIAALAARELRSTESAQLATFAVDFTDSREYFSPTVLRPELDTPYAQLAARALETEHHEIVLDADSLSANLPAARRARDLPSLGQFDTSMYGLFAGVREQAVVALSGEGADEFFGGYPWFHDPTIIRRDTFPWLADGADLTDCLAPDVRARIRPAEMVKDLYGTMLAEVPRLEGETGLDARMREIIYLSMQGPLALLLDRKDRMGMAVGLEVRVPFCDHRLVEYLWNIPWTLKTADGREKSLLRAAVRDLLPEPVLYRAKSAYPASFDPTYAAHVVDQTRALIRDPSSPLAGLLDPARVDDLIDHSGPSMVHANAAHVLIPLVEVDIWMRTLKVGIA